MHTSPRVLGQCELQLLWSRSSVRLTAMHWPYITYLKRCKCTQSTCCVEESNEICSYAGACGSVHFSLDDSAAVTGLACCFWKCPAAGCCTLTYGLKYASASAQSQGIANVPDVTPGTSDIEEPNILHSTDSKRSDTCLHGPWAKCMLLAEAVLQIAASWTLTACYSWCLFIKGDKTVNFFLLTCCTTFSPGCTKRLS